MHIEYQSTINRRCSEDNFDAFEMFVEHFGCFPKFVFKGGGLTEDDNYLDSEEIQKQTPIQCIHDLDQAVTDFKNSIIALELRINTIIKYHNFNSINGVYQTFLVFTGLNIIVQITHVSSKKHKNVFLYSINNEPYQCELLDKLVKLISDLFPNKPAKKDEIKIISQEGGSFYMTAVNLSKRQHIFDYDNYNDDFKLIAERTIKALSVENASGLVLFHGIIGSGKTSMLKHLINIIDTKQVIYLPPDLTSSLSSPSFVNFLITNATNSILLIEDAENVLKHREAGGSQAVSNILNISDGILGDVLKTQIVCTFNCDIEELDKALFRGGRLISCYQFNKLTEIKTKKLMNKLYGDNVLYCNKPMSLAEIYNFEKMPDKNTPDDKQKVGFI